MKFSSSIFIENCWEQDSVINIQKEQRFYFGSYVQPASCSEIRKFASELMKAFNRRRNDVSIKSRTDDNNDDESYVDSLIKETIKIYSPFM